MSKIIINGERCIMGRVASFVAKQVLQGNEVVILNSEKVLVVGNKTNILEKYKVIRKKGKGQKMKGPIFPTFPERIMKRAVRGMMRYSEGRGKIAFTRVRCYKGVPAEYEKVESISPFKLEKERKAMTLEQLSRLLRGGQ